MRWLEDFPLRHVWVVNLTHSREDGLYLFTDEDDARRFKRAAERRGELAVLTEEPIFAPPEARDLIRAEAQGEA